MASVLPRRVCCGVSALNRSGDVAGLRSIPGSMEADFLTQAAWVWMLMLFNSSSIGASTAEASDADPVAADKHEIKSTTQSTAKYLRIRHSDRIKRWRVK